MGRLENVPVRAADRAHVTDLRQMARTDGFVVGGKIGEFLSVSFVRFPDREAGGASLGQKQNWKPGQESPQLRAYTERKLKEAQDFRPIVEKAVRNRL